MAKLLAFVTLLALFSQGFAQLNEIVLDDVHITHVANPLFGRSIGIAKHPFDTLLSCLITLPNGVTNEAFPNNNIADSNILFSPAVEPFNSCSVTFHGVSSTYSGIYELQSVVQHEDGSTTLSSQKFHMNFINSEVEWPSINEVDEESPIISH